MVGDDAQICRSIDPADRAMIVDLEKRLRGPGIDGL
jgi:hypothetical protein